MQVICGFSPFLNEVLLSFVNLCNNRDVFAKDFRKHAVNTHIRKNKKSWLGVYVVKKVVLVLFAFLFFSVGQAFAYRVTDFSTDAKIVAAMRVLEQAGENDVFRNLQRYGMRIKFDDEW